MFRGTGPGIILIIFFAALSLWGKALFGGGNGFNAFDSGKMIFYGLFGHLTESGSIAGTILAFSLVMVTVALIITFNTRTLFLNERTFLPGFIYILITSLIPDYQYLNPVIPSVILLHLAVMRIAGSYRKNGTAFCYFDAALMIGTGSLFYANLIWYGLILFIGLGLLRSPDVREVIVSVLGLLTPYVFVFGIYYVAGSDLAVLTSAIENSLFGAGIEPSFPRIVIVSLLFVAFTILIAAIHLGSLFSTIKVKARKIFSLQVWVALITIAVYFISPSGNAELLYIFALPSSYMLSNYYIHARGSRIIHEPLFVTTILLAVATAVITAL